MYSDAQHKIHGLPEWSDAQWQYLRELLQLPWFSRTWVIQEVALSSLDPIILHGRLTYSWERLGWVASWLRRVVYLRHSQMPNRLQNVDTISNIRRSHTPWHLDALLVATSCKFNATDQRDKVYGLLGLAAETQDLANWPAALQPDYKLDAERVYARVGRHLMRTSGSPALLTRMPPAPTENFGRQRYMRLKTKASWIPNWSDLLAREPTRSLAWLYYSDTGGPTLLGYPRHFRASDGLPAEIENSENAGELRLKGVIVDTVADHVRYDAGKLWSIFLDPYKASQAKAHLSSAWAMVNAAHNGRGVAVEDLLDQFVTTATAKQSGLAGRNDSQIKADGRAFLLSALRVTRSRDCFASLLRWAFPATSASNISLEESPLLPGVLSSQLKQSPNVESSPVGDPDAFASLARNYCYNRSFLVTRDGCMGIGPAGLRRGDEIVVLFGGGVPCVLRRHGNSHLLIGEAYVHGLMNGEAIRDLRSGVLKEQTVCLV